LANAVRFLITLSLLITACGKPRMGMNGVEGIDGVTTGGYKGEKPYTGYGPRPDIEKIQEHVPDSASNKEFAGQIESAFLLRHHGRVEASNALRVHVKWQGLEKPLEFWGEIKNENDKFTATLNEETDQKKGLVMTAACNNSSCDVVTAYLLFNRVIKAGMIFRLEKRTIQARISPRDLQLITCYDPKIQAATQRYVKGVEVTVASTEIVPGRTHFKLYEKEGANSSARLEGDLLTTDGDCMPIQGENDEAIFARVCLAGNDGGGSLVFRAKLPALPKTCKVTQPTKPSQPKANQSGQSEEDEPSIFLQVKRPSQPGNAPTPAVPGPLCSLPVPADKVHPIVKAMYKDCGNPIVNRMLNLYWGSKGTRKGQLVKFLNLQDASLRGQSQGQVQAFTTMKRVLKAAQLPPTLGFVTVQESGFDANIRGRDGEIGYWQFMPNTARGVGLDPKLRNQIGPSTQAAARLFHQLIRQFTNSRGEVNIKMVLASYNAGSGASDRAENTMQAHKRSGASNFVHLTRQQIEAYSQDFWELYELKMLPNVTRNYVPSVLGLIFAGVRPDKAGISGVSGFTELD
jgi:hypothetical protein